MAKSEIVRAIKGMNDIVPFAPENFLDSKIWQKIVHAAEETFEAYGYRFVRLPVVEDTQLFIRGVGSETDIVSKEMYSFEDRGGRRLTLRPEGTAGAVRAYVEHSYFHHQPVQRWWYLGPMFRAERPQKGRYRQFYQIGVEFFGVDSVASDVEILCTLNRFFQALKLDTLTLRINSLGDEKSRQNYEATLCVFFDKIKKDFPDDLHDRMKNNPLRFLDSKVFRQSGHADSAPDMIDSLSEDARTRFDGVLSGLNRVGIPFKRDPTLVRGLDYYSHTVFEFSTQDLGAQDAIGGGGRYDQLVSELGGPATPAIGFAAGIERLALLLAAQEEQDKAFELCILPMEGYAQEAIILAESIRDVGDIKIEVDLTGLRLKAMFKRADKIGARLAMVVGEDEIAHKRSTIRDLSQRDAEQEVALDARLIHDVARDMLDGRMGSDES
ncbi:MAG: histidine--tRNA ligase [Myxococcota bacterium]|jgi:histidyl-tRNA synthetase|nr:histidine--tRNA ligase [Myxococcota bacterium]